MARLKPLSAGRSNRRRGEGGAKGRAPSRDRRAQRLERPHRIVPAEAGVGDALAVRELGRIVLAGGELLRAGVEMAFDHDAEDAAAAAFDLRADVARDLDLARVELAAVGVAA